MRKVFVSAAASALILGLTACSNSSPQASHDSTGVTGATVKRAAVPGGHVDFGGDASSVESYDLQTQGASVANPVDASDFERDQEIDSIVGKISNDGASSPEQAQTPAGSGKRTPAVPSKLSSAGLTGSLGPAPSSALPPLPESVSNPPAASEDPAMAAEQARLFPKPLWRRKLEQKSQTQQGPAPAGN